MFARWIATSPEWKVHLMLFSIFCSLSLFNMGWKVYGAHWEIFLLFDLLWSRLMMHIFRFWARVSHIMHRLTTVGKMVKFAESSVDIKECRDAFHIVVGEASNWPLATKYTATPFIMTDMFIHDMEKIILEVEASDAKINELQAQIDQINNGKN